jgi:hypothetical protein
VIKGPVAKAVLVAVPSCSFGTGGFHGLPPKKRQSCWNNSGFGNACRSVNASYAGAETYRAAGCIAAALIRNDATPPQDQPVHAVEGVPNH